MDDPSVRSLRGRPGVVGGGLAVAVLLLDALVGVSVDDVSVALLVAGVVAAIWGGGDARTAGVAVGVAGAGALVGARVVGELPGGILGLLAVVAALSLVGVASR